MRKINKDLTDIPESLEVNDQKPTHRRRKELIKKGAYVDEIVYNNRYKTSDIKNKLNNLYHHKCAYCEYKVEQGHIEHFVNISDYELDYMTYENMSSPEKKANILGPYIKDWSPQQRAHFICEKMLENSGLNVTNVRATMFVENPIISMLPLQGLSEGKLYMPLSDKKVALITSYDLAEAISVILMNTEKYGGKTITLTGKKLLSGKDIAEGFSIALSKKIEYIPVELDTWTEKYISYIFLVLLLFTFVCSSEIFTAEKMHSLHRLSLQFFP